MNKIKFVIGINENTMEVVSAIMGHSTLAISGLPENTFLVVYEDYSWKTMPRGAVTAEMQSHGKAYVMRILQILSPKEN